MNQPKNFAVLHENQTTSYQISGVAGTNTTVLEEEEDPSVVNLSDYIDEDDVQSDIHINIEGGGRSPSCFFPISTNSNGAYNQFNSITPTHQYCRASSTIQSQSSGDQASTQTRSSISIESSGALSEFLEAAMVQSEGNEDSISIENLGALSGSLEAAMVQSEGNDTKMAETVDLDCPEESHENAGGAKPDEDDQDGQDYKKQCSAEPYSMSRTGEKRKSRAVKNQQNSHLFLSERSRLYEFSQSNRILLVIPSSQSVNEESSILVHTLNPSIEAIDAEILRVYDHIVKDYPDLIIETGRTETTIRYKLHELVPFSIGLCREMVVRDNSSKETLGVRSAVLRDGSLNKVFANCICIVTNALWLNT